MPVQKPQSLGPWSGIDNVHLPTYKSFQLPTDKSAVSSLVTATDVDLLDDGWIKSREGVTDVLSGTAFSYLAAKGGLLLCQDGTTLYKVVGSTPTSLVTGLTARVVAHEFPTGGAQVFVTDGTTAKRIVSSVVSNWGLQTPTTPTITSTTGDLPPGSYIITTSLRTGALATQTAIESGAQPLLRYNLATTGGLTINQPVTDASATHVAFYVSRTDAPIPFRVAVQPVVAGTASLTISINSTLGSSEIPPLTLNWGPPPTGITHLGSWQGFMLASVGTALYRAWPTQPNLWWQVPMVLGSTITSIVGLQDGFYVGTTRGLYWVKGSPEPSTWAFQRVDEAGIIPEGDIVPGHAIPALETSGPVAMFVAKDGVIAGLPNGQIKRLTYNRYHFPSATRVQVAYSTQKRRLFIAVTE